MISARVPLILPLHKAERVNSRERCSNKRATRYHAGEDPENMPRCMNDASYVVDGVPLCGRHASTVALQAIVRESLASMPRRALPGATSHDLYKDGDVAIPSVICDSNGQVTLGLCKVCGQAEADLEPQCPGQRAKP